MIDRFRREVYQSFEQRGDAGMDLIDALTSAESVESPVAQSESPLFRRRFSSVYDFLKERVACSCRNYGECCTRISLRMQNRLPDTKSMWWTAPMIRRRKRKRCWIVSVRRRVAMRPVEVGHRYSWLVRAIRGTHLMVHARRHTPCTYRKYG